MKPAFALFALLASALAPAHAGQLVDVAITDLDEGRVLPLYAHSGRQYVAGVPGHRYALALTNRTGERVLAVVSVDGVNAVSGETAGAQQAGYVLGPWESAQISGWRKSLSDVAEFYFTDLPDSYAARTGRPQNVGVIGVAVFRERRPYFEPRPVSPPVAKSAPQSRGDGAAGAREQRAPAAAGAGAPQPVTEASDAMAQQELGTGHGERRYDPVSTTEFVRASRWPGEVVSIHYDDWNSLVARGVIPRQPHYPHYPTEPDPFPMGFVPDP